MAGIKRIVLDVLVPLNLSTVEISNSVASLAGVEGVDILIQEIERKVETTKITIEGERLEFDSIKGVLEGMGASIQNIDRVSAGRRLVG